MLQPLDFLRDHGRAFPAWDLASAKSYTRRLTQEHYENFSVANRILLPSRLYQDYCNLYAYCRWSDDLADETGDPQLSLDLLAWWRGELHAAARGESGHPVFVALRETAQRHELPRQDFEDLLDAFVQDQTVLRYRTFDDLLAYCRGSANPVGRLVLRLNGVTDQSLLELSDFICTALQLANHWQDTHRDWLIGRCYIPEKSMASHGFSYDQLAADMRAGTASERYRRTLAALVGCTDELFRAGLPLANRLGGRLGFEIELFARAGMRVLEMIRELDYDTVQARPTMSRADQVRLGLGIALNRL